MAAKVVARHPVDHVFDAAATLCTARWSAAPVTLLTGVTIVTIASVSGLRSRSFGSQNHQRHLLRAGPGIGSGAACAPSRGSYARVPIFPRVTSHHCGHLKATG